MAYLSKETKKEREVEIKKVLKKYRLKGSVARNHSTLVVNISGGELDLLGSVQNVINQQSERRSAFPHPVGTYHQVNEFYEAEWLREAGEDQAADLIEELIKAMKGDSWYDRSDIMNDYFDTAYYLEINIGKWNKPYNYTGK